LLSRRRARKLRDSCPSALGAEASPTFGPSDNAWDAIHRCLTDDVSGEGSHGEYPLNQVICGGRQLHHGEEWIVSLVTAEQVKDECRDWSAYGALDARAIFFIAEA
jgi:hypothetical protein